MQTNQRIVLAILSLLVIGLLAPGLAFGAATAELDLTAHWVGFAALAIFVAAYSLVIAEEFTHLRKSKPVMLAAGIIWVFIAMEYANNELTHSAETAVREPYRAAIIPPLRPGASSTS